jgi:hypothetical protein
MNLAQVRRVALKNCRVCSDRFVFAQRQLQPSQWHIEEGSAEELELYRLGPSPNALQAIPRAHEHGFHSPFQTRLLTRLMFLFLSPHVLTILPIPRLIHQPTASTPLRDKPSK